MTDTLTSDMKNAALAEFYKTTTIYRGERARLFAALAAALAASPDSEKEKNTYVPGVWQCAKCDFRLVQSNLNALDGTVTANDKPGEKCPNCDVPLWRVSWKQDAIEATNRMGQYFDETQALKAQLAERDGQLLALRGALTPSTDTKVAYMGEFRMNVRLRLDGDEELRTIYVPWTTIKEIMAAIRNLAGGE